MPALSITKTYADNQVLNESDLDNIINDVENFMNTTKLDNVNIQTNGILTANIADEAITAAKIAAAVAGDGLAGGAGTALSVNVDDSTIEIDSDTLRVKDAGIGPAKLAAVNLESSGKVTRSTTSLTYVDLAGFSISITTNGRPVCILIQAVYDATDNFGGIILNDNVSSFNIKGFIRLIRDSTVLSDNEYGIFTSSGGADPIDYAYCAPGVIYIDTPAAGTYTYKLQGHVLLSSTAMVLENCELVAYEL